MSLTDREGPKRARFVDVGVHLADDVRPLATFENLEGMTEHLGPAGSAALPLDRHVLLVPDARVLVVVPFAGDRLVLHRLDPEALVGKANFDYLAVTSRPPPRFRPGAAYTYRLVVRSSNGGVRCARKSGPAGMAVADDRLTWAVPKDFAKSEVDVTLSVRDASGREVPHAFRIYDGPIAGAPGR